jgi:hypothetical protein
MATDTFIKIRGNRSYFDRLDDLAAAVGAVSKADLLERLVSREMSRLGWEPTRRLDPNKHDSFARRKRG